MSVVLQIAEKPLKNLANRRPQIRVQSTQIVERMLNAISSLSPTQRKENLRVLLSNVGQFLPISSEARRETSEWLLALGARSARELFAAQTQLLVELLTEALARRGVPSAEGRVSDPTYVQAVVYDFTKREHRNPAIRAIRAGDQQEILARVISIAHGLDYAASLEQAVELMEAIVRNTYGLEGKRFEAAVELFTDTLVLLHRASVQPRAEVLSEGEAASMIKVWYATAPLDRAR